MTQIPTTPLAAAVDAAFAGPDALLALGIPACPSCDLLSVTLGEIAAARSDLRVLRATMDTPQDWASRETLLWPRGIHVSRASVPAMVLVRAGRVIASRQGGGPAAVLDEWISEHLGAATQPLPSGISAREREMLDGLAERRAELLAAKAARNGVG